MPDKQNWIPPYVGSFSCRKENQGTNFLSLQSNTYSKIISLFTTSDLFVFLDCRCTVKIKGPQVTLSIIANILTDKNDPSIIIWYLLHCFASVYLQEQHRAFVIVRQCSQSLRKSVALRSSQTSKYVTLQLLNRLA